MAPRHAALTLLTLLLLTVAAYPALWTAPYVYEDANWRATLGTPAQWVVPSRDLTRATLGWAQDRPGIDHAINVGLHLGNGVLLYALGAALVTPAVGLVAALVLLWHPFSSEAVSYISGRADLLVTGATLAAVLLTVQWADRGGWVRLVGAALATLAAATSKEMGVLAVPLVVLTLIVWRRGPQTTFVLNVLWGSLGLVVGASASRIGSWVAMPPMQGGSVFAWPEFAALQLATVARLVALIVWPVGFSVDHDALMLGPVWLAVGVLGLVAGSGAAIWAWRRSPLVLWTVGWVAVCLAPRFVFATNEFVREYQLYLAFAGIALGLAAWTQGEVRHDRVSTASA